MSYNVTWSEVYIFALEGGENLGKDCKHICNDCNNPNYVGLRSIRIPKCSCKLYLKYKVALILLLGRGSYSLSIYRNLDCGQESLYVPSKHIFPFLWKSSMYL